MPQNRATLMCIAALLMGGCGGAMDDATVEPSATESTPQAIYKGYNPDLDCLVQGPYVSCGPGQSDVYAYYDPVWGYYVPRDACGRNGPLICPHY